MRALRENYDHFAQEYNLQKLMPIKNFLQTKKINGKLFLDDADKSALTELVNQCVGIKVSFEGCELNCLEVLELAISPFVNSSRDRAKILCTTSGSLRNIGVNIYSKLNANNRFHAMLIAARSGVIGL